MSDRVFVDTNIFVYAKLKADKQNISLHIQNIYEEGELVPEATVKKYLTVRREFFETHSW